MKALKPSHKEKKRYLLVKGKNVNKKNIEDAILEFIGVLGYAESSPHFIKDQIGEIILAINRKSLDKVRTSLLMSNKDLNIVKVGGNLKKVKN